MVQLRQMEADRLEGEEADGHRIGAERAEHEDAIACLGRLAEPQSGVARDDVDRCAPRSSIGWIGEIHGTDRGRADLLLTRPATADRGRPGAESQGTRPPGPSIPRRSGQMPSRVVASPTNGVKTWNQRPAARD